MFKTFYKPSDISRTMAKKLSINTITAGDIKRRHPRYLTCDTDRQYARLANDIYILVRDGLKFMKEHEIRNASISLALYFEDQRSETHQFEAFTHLYQKMFERYLPFYHSVDANAPKAEIEAMKFILWHSICAERNGRIVNPTNDGLANIAANLLRFWKERKTGIEPNEELADYLYSEETQTNVNEVKTVLIWLCLHSLFGRWFNNPDVRNDDARLKELLPFLDKDTLEYANECHYVFKEQAGPLSLTPQRIYAEMIRIDMDDPTDPMASAVEGIRFKPFTIYQIVESDSLSMLLKDFLGDTFRVKLNGFFGNVKKVIKQNTHIEGSFLNMNGLWEVNGPSMWLTPEKNLFDKYLEEERLKHHMMNDYAGQYDDYINKHHGRRLYFFRDVKMYLSWLQNDLGIVNAAEQTEPIDNGNEPLVAFMEDNGQITISQTAEFICHPDNPYYDRSYAEENSLFLIAHDSCSPGMLLYLIEHNLLPDAMLNDIRGREHGRHLMQENLEFLVRCMRRDIKSDVVFHKRTDTEKDTDGDLNHLQYGTKLPYEKFVELIAEEKNIRSKANKEWKVVRANKTTTVIRDVSKRQDYTIPTRNLYEAHLNLEEEEIQISNVAPYVGKKNAPAASALLYNVVGQRQAFNYIRKHFKDIFKNSNQNS